MRQFHYPYQEFSWRQVGEPQSADSTEWQHICLLPLLLSVIMDKCIFPSDNYYGSLILCCLSITKSCPWGLLLDLIPTKSFSWAKFMNIKSRGWVRKLDIYLCLKGWGHKGLAQHVEERGAWGSSLPTCSAFVSARDSLLSLGGGCALRVEPARILNQQHMCMSFATNIFIYRNSVSEVGKIQRNVLVETVNQSKIWKFRKIIMWNKYLNRTNQKSSDKACSSTCIYRLLMAFCCRIEMGSNFYGLYLYCCQWSGIQSSAELTSCHFWANDDARLLCIVNGIVALCSALYYFYNVLYQYNINIVNVTLWQETG